MLINLDEWKAVQRAKGGILKVSAIMKMNGGKLNVRELQDCMYMVTGEYFSVDVRMQALEDLLTTDDIKATIINTETVIITF